MKRIEILILVFFFFYGCEMSSSGKKRIKLSDIESIKVTDSPDDSTGIMMIEMDIKTFVNKWNDAESIGMCKYFPEHWIKVK